MIWDARSSSTHALYRNLSFDEVRHLVLDGDLTPEDWVRSDADRTWRELGTLADFADVIPAFTFRRRTATDELDDEMDMTPMIDVVFQILIFFMLTASFHKQKSLSSPLGEQEKQAQNIPTLGQLGRDSIVVSIAADNKIEIWHYNDRGALQNKETVEVGDLEAKFRAISERDRKNELIVQSDDRAHHKVLVAVLDAAGQVGLENIRLAQPTARQPAAGRLPDAKPGAADNKSVPAEKAAPSKPAPKP